MTTIESLGIRVDVPTGWEAAIYRREANNGELTHAIAHVASFPLPPGRGDFGSGAVDTMTAEDVLLVLLEYAGDSAGTALFAEQGLPRWLASHQFSPSTLQRVVHGHAGVQRFFTESGRAFCLYCVIGSSASADVLVPRLNSLLQRIHISGPRAS